MAAEAVYKIKEAEDAGKEIIRKAKEDAKHLLSVAGETGLAQKQASHKGALQRREQLIQEAVTQARQSCEGIQQTADAERQRLLTPDSSRLEHAIQLVMERIVSV